MVAVFPHAGPSSTPNPLPSSTGPIVGGVVGGILVVIIIIVVVVVVIVVVVLLKRRKESVETYDTYAEVSKAPQPPPIPAYFYNKGYAEITTTRNGHIELVQTQHSHQDSGQDSVDFPMPAKLRTKPDFLQANPMYASADHLDKCDNSGPSMRTSGSLPLLDPSSSPFNSQFNIYAEPSKVPPPVPSYHGSLDGSLYNEDINPKVFRDSNSELSPHSLANPVGSIYANPSPIARSDALLEVKEKNIRTIRELGMGQFGEVVLAHTVGLSLKELKLSESNTDPGVSIVVAVKRLKPDADEATREAFEKEIKFMARLNHENVVRLVGVCLSSNAFIMMQYMEDGDLNQFLRGKTLVPTTDKPVKEGTEVVSIPQLIYVCLQVAAGMRYLASLHFIHRDLATRNCLVGQNFTVKIADFGMSRDLYNSYYYRIKGRAMLPIRWMANECFYGQFSEKTDVWAFGVAMWEVFTLCKKQPYEELTDQQVIDDAVRESDRTLLSQPNDCPSEVYHVMLRCWVHEPKERANFEELHQLLSQIHAYSDLA